MKPQVECSCSSDRIKRTGRTDYEGHSFLTFFFIENDIIQDKIKGQPHQTTKH